MKQIVIVGFSGGVTSAWCAGWALREYPREEVVLLWHDTKREYPREEVVLLWHDTKREHPDTYRFLREMSDALGVPITERSDGRSVVELFYDEGFLGNNQNAMCSRILKREQGERYRRELQAQGHHVVRVFGFSENEPDRIQRAWAEAEAGRYEVRFPLVETGTTKQQCADWCNCEVGVRPSAMYEHFEHANCIGCVKGGRAYWLAVHKHHPDVFYEMADMEEEFGHTIIRGGDRDHPRLRELVQLGLKRRVTQREAITIGPCECGD